MDVIFVHRKQCPLPRQTQPPDWGMLLRSRAQLVCSTHLPLPWGSCEQCTNCMALKPAASSHPLGVRFLVLATYNASMCTNSWHGSIVEQKTGRKNSRVQGKRGSCGSGAHTPDWPPGTAALTRGTAKEVALSPELPRQGRGRLSHTDLPLCSAGLKFLGQEQSHSFWS